MLAGGYATRSAAVSRSVSAVIPGGNGADGFMISTLARVSTTRGATWPAQSAQRK